MLLIGPCTPVRTLTPYQENPFVLDNLSSLENPGWLNLQCHPQSSMSVLGTESEVDDPGCGAVEDDLEPRILTNSLHDFFANR